jgi:hypothetical protein
MVAAAAWWSKRKPELKLLTGEVADTGRYASAVEAGFGALSTHVFGECSDHLIECRLLDAG